MLSALVSIVVGASAAVLAAGTTGVEPDCIYKEDCNYPQGNCWNAECVCQHGFVGQHCESVALEIDCLHGESSSTGAAAACFCLGAWRAYQPLTDQPMPTVGDLVRLHPAHVDPTVAKHEQFWVIDGDRVVDRWAIDFRHW